MAKKGLGKGLGALFPERDIKKEITHIELSLLRPNPFQPRADANDSEIESLAQSIKEKGIIQPVVVRKSGNFYEIVCGERRYWAAKKAGLTRIPVVIKQLGDKEVLELALIENIQRKDLNPIEEAKSYLRLTKEFGLTQSEVAKLTGKKRTTITNTLRLLRLPNAIQEMLQNGKITEGHARTLLSLKNHTAIFTMVHKIIDKNLSVRETEELIKKSPRITRRKPAPKDLFINELENKLREKMGTKCSIRTKGKRGKIIIEFYSKEDLERILNILSIGID
ncbi:MAG: hypothetical protein B5M53_08420 [Candidatus Cloacimonas sp. 4484_209]|nr:MAG: hypothetical protein B5M53_08420 [Candidatus Cloacimonas sp. 4484_209]